MTASPYVRVDRHRPLSWGTFSSSARTFFRLADFQKLLVPSAANRFGDIEVASRVDGRRMGERELARHVAGSSDAAHKGTGGPLEDPDAVTSKVDDEHECLR